MSMSWETPQCGAQYRLFGLRVHTSRPLGLSLPCCETDSPDLSVCFTTNTPVPEQDCAWQTIRPPLPRHLDQISIARCHDVVRVRFSMALGKIAYFYDEKQKSLLIVHEPTVCATDIDSLFLGSILGFVLRRRGNTCLHASVVELAGQTILFTGHKGAGKSTAAAAMIEHQGAKLIADDMAVLQKQSGQLTVAPGYPAHRLNSDAFTALKPEALDNAPPVYNFNPEKRYLATADRSETKQLHPIAAVFDLETSESALNVPMPKALAVQSMLKHSYASFGLCTQTDLATELRDFATLAGQAPVFPVPRHGGLKRLKDFTANIRDLVPS